jgi:hypothetical protein
MTDKLIKEISDNFLDFEGLEIPKDGIPIICRAMQAYHEAKMKEITDEDIEAYFKTWQNPRIKTADEQYEQWLNRYLEELIDSAIEGAKAMRDGEIKHNG